MIYFINNGCYWITSAIDKNYSNIFVLSVYKIKKGEGFIPFKNFWLKFNRLRLFEKFFLYSDVLNKILGFYFVIFLCTFPVNSLKVTSAWKRTFRFIDADAMRDCATLNLPILLSIFPKDISSYPGNLWCI